MKANPTEKERGEGANSRIVIGILVNDFSMQLYLFHNIDKAHVQLL